MLSSRNAKNYFFVDSADNASNKLTYASKY